MLREGEGEGERGGGGGGRSERGGEEGEAAGGAGRLAFQFGVESGQRQQCCVGGGEEASRGVFRAEGFRMIPVVENNSSEFEEALPFFLSQGGRWGEGVGR